MCRTSIKQKKKCIYMISTDFKQIEIHVMSEDVHVNVINFFEMRLYRVDRKKKFLVLEFQETILHLSGSLTHRGTQ